MKLEFDDVKNTGSFVYSVKARDTMRYLATKYKLFFNMNPGGGEFNGRINGILFRCQISTCDDVYDVNILNDNIDKALHK